MHYNHIVDSHQYDGLGVLINYVHTLSLFSKQKQMKIKKRFIKKIPVTIAYQPYL